MLSVHLPDGYSGSLFFQKKNNQKPSKMSKFVVTKLGHKAVPFFAESNGACNFRGFIRFRKFSDLTCHRFWVTKHVPGSDTSLVLPIKNAGVIILKKGKWGWWLWWMHDDAARWLENGDSKPIILKRTQSRPTHKTSGIGAALPFFSNFAFWFYKVFHRDTHTYTHTSVAYVYIYILFFKYTIIAILTCNSFVILEYRDERPIEPSSSWFPPKFPSG